MISAALITLVAVGLYSSFIFSLRSTKTANGNLLAYNLAVSVCNQMVAKQYAGLEQMQADLDLNYNYFDPATGGMVAKTLPLGSETVIRLDTDRISRERIATSGEPASGSWAWAHAGDKVTNVKTTTIVTIDPKTGQSITKTIGGPTVLNKDMTGIDQALITVKPEIIRPTTPAGAPTNAAKDPMDYFIVQVTVSPAKGKTPLTMANKPIVLRSLVSRVSGAGTQLSQVSPLPKE